MTINSAFDFTSALKVKILISPTVTPPSLSHVQFMYLTNFRQPGYKAVIKLIGPQIFPEVPLI
jgi:hypothetical protein